MTVDRFTKRLAKEVKSQGFSGYTAIVSSKDYTLLKQSHFVSTVRVGGSGYLLYNQRPVFFITRHAGIPEGCVVLTKSDYTAGRALVLYGDNLPHYQKVAARRKKQPAFEKKSKVSVVSRFERAPLV